MNGVTGVSKMERKLMLQKQEHLSCKRFFGGRFVGRGFWPSPSSDLTSPDFFLMGIS
jgi:hypothetical protein